MNNQVQVFCIPHAGGSAGVFRKWRDSAPDGLEIVPLELAGRGSRTAEPFSPTVPEAARDLISQLRTLHNGRPFVVLGHCMGAVVAYEMVRRLRATGGQEPSLLVVSGRNPPHLQTDWGLRVAPLPDDQLFEELQAVGGVPPRLSRAMAGAFLPVVRADQRMVHCYDVGGAEPRIGSPVVVLAGAQDSMTGAEVLPGWSEYTEGSCTVEFFDGGHYFLYDWLDDVAGVIVERITESVAR